MKKIDKKLTDKPIALPRLQQIGLDLRDELLFCLDHDRNFSECVKQGNAYCSVNRLAGPNTKQDERVLYAATRYSGNKEYARHINFDGNPLCGQTNSFSWNTEMGRPTCKKCISLRRLYI